MVIIVKNNNKNNILENSEPPDFRSGTGRDKALSLLWTVRDVDLQDFLDLPRTKTSKGTQAQESIILDAVLEAAGTGRWISYSRRAEHYSNRYGPYGYRIVISSVDNLVAAGLLLHEKASPGQNVGWQSRFRASPLLIASFPVPLVRADPGELVRLRDQDKMEVDYRNTAATHRMRRNLHEINEAIASIDIGIDIPGASHIGNVLKIGDYVVNTANDSLHRVFNVDFGHGGRFYGLCVQGMSKRHRQEITMNGSRTVEEDHHQIHPRMVYDMAGKALDDDAYTIPGWERDLCKKAFNILLNAKNYRDAQGATANEIGLADGLGYPGYKNSDCVKRAAALIDAIKARHQPIADYFHTGIGLRLQNKDARMAEFNMGKLQKRGIVALPIHDSFIVEDRHQGAQQEVMEEAWSVT